MGEALTAKQFEKECKAAEALVSTTDRQFFFRVVKSKVVGDAQNKLQYCEIETLEELYAELKRIYSPPQNLAQIQSELARVVQEKDEKVNDYGWRVKRTLHRAIESIEDDFEKVAADGMIVGIRKIALNCYMIGLRPEITVLMGFQSVTNLEEAISKATEYEQIIKIQKGLRKDDHELEEPKRKMRCYNIETGDENRQTRNQKEVLCYRCNKRGHMIKHCTANMQEIESRKYGGEGTKGRCFYCNKMGHFARDCRRKQEEEMGKERKTYRRERAGNSCNYCMKDGHTFEFCKERKSGQEHCGYCGARGHRIEECRRKKKSQEEREEEKPKSKDLNMK